VRTGRVCRGWCGIGGLLRFRRFRRFRFPCLERVRLRRQRLRAMRSPLEVGDASRHANLTVGDEGPGESCFEITAMDRPAHLPERAKAVLSEADHDCVLCVGSVGREVVGLAHCSFCGSFCAENPGWAPRWECGMQRGRGWWMSLRSSTQPMVFRSDRLMPSVMLSSPPSAMRERGAWGAPWVVPVLASPPACCACPHAPRIGRFSRLGHQEFACSPGRMNPQGP
jgi:hypothetical protein